MCKNNNLFQVLVFCIVCKKKENVQSTQISLKSAFTFNSKLLICFDIPEVSRTKELIKYQIP